MPLASGISGTADLVGIEGRTRSLQKARILLLEILHDCYLEVFLVKCEDLHECKCAPIPVPYYCDIAKSDVFSAV